MYNTVSVVGLGRLGLPLALCIADKNIKVLGNDINQELLACIEEKKQATWFEPDLDSSIKHNLGKNLHLVKDKIDLISKSDITIILVDTPTDSFSNKNIINVISEMGNYLKDSTKPYHLFIISSTVMPEDINKIFIPILESISERKLNKGFGLCYVPDFVALGTVIKDFKNPDMILIGGSKKEDIDKTKELYVSICDNSPEIVRTSIPTAEISKVALNVYLTSKISFINTIMNLCQKIPETDIDDVTRLLGSDRRINSRYLRGGLSYGGNCFPRDVRALKIKLEEHSIPTVIPEAIDSTNEHQYTVLYDLITKIARPDDVIGIIGLSFKEGTSVTTASPMKRIVDMLKESNYITVVHDPRIESLRLKECVDQADILVLNHTDNLGELIMLLEHQNKTVIDCWRTLDTDKVIRYGTYI